MIVHHRRPADQSSSGVWLDPSLSEPIRDTGEVVRRFQAAASSPDFWIVVFPDGPSLNVRLARTAQIVSSRGGETGGIAVGAVTSNGHRFPCRVFALPKAHVTSEQLGRVVDTHVRNDKSKVLVSDDRETDALLLGALCGLITGKLSHTGMN